MSQKTSSSPLHLPFLEGMRALCMIIVLVFHVFGMWPDSPNLPIGSWIGDCVLHGQVGVVGFIVLSGYCLMLPVLSSKEGQLRGGLGGFFRRRALRILPAYYASLAASIALAWLVTIASQRFGLGDRGFENVLTFKNIVTHLFMVHNLWIDTVWTLNGVHWSVATEWQIYFVFALVLLPLRKKLGMGFSFLFALVLGVIPTYLLPESENFYWLRPWYLGLFALGMLTAEYQFSPLNYRISYNKIFVCFSLICIVLHFKIGYQPVWYFDTLIGVTFASMVGCFAEVHKKRERQGDHSFKIRIVKLLEHSSLSYLAGISYSVYLFQHIIFKAVLTVTKMLHLEIYAIFINIFVTLPLCILVGHFASRYFEKPFLSRRSPAMA